jgi:molybdenum cofactor cytidylyltransferase
VIAAIVPAAGQSRRMGQPKLLLEFDGTPLIHRVVTALRNGGVPNVVVVVPAANIPESAPLASAARTAGATVIVPNQQPQDMRASIELAIARLASESAPDHLLLAPADSPGITPQLVKTLSDQSTRSPTQILIPAHQGKRGHPVIFPWPIIIALNKLEPGLGLNALVARNNDRVLEIPAPDPTALFDLDTPEDLARWSQQQPKTFKAKVRLFASARERLGTAEIEIDMSPPATVAQLRRTLRERWPELDPIWSAAMIALDEEYAADTSPIEPSSRLAVIPPVSGGTTSHTASKIKQW